jgi:hypothetical protein
MPEGSTPMRAPVSCSSGESLQEGQMDALSERTPVLGLFETHLTVRDLQRSIRFYREVVGLTLRWRSQSGGLDPSSFSRTARRSGCRGQPAWR